jgi:hypothetical protein
MHTKTCALCQRSFRNIRSLIKHVNLAHNFDSKDYYDRFVKNELEGRCFVCSEVTEYRGASIGYLKYCSMICAHSCRVRREKVSSSKRGTKQSEEHIRKRIQSTDQGSKEKARKCTLLKNFGVDNPGQIPHVKKALSLANKGSVKPRSREHQSKIILSRTINGTLKHTDLTKEKISKAIHSSEKVAAAIEMGLHVTHEKKHSRCLSGKLGEVHFRSSYELAFLLEMHKNGIEVISAENKSFRVKYEFQKKTCYYYPDFFIPSDQCLVEIKPKNLLKHGSNPQKFEAAEQYCKSMNYDFRIYTEEHLMSIKDIVKCIDENLLKDLVILKNEHILFR